jgi:hypothetical protein
MPRARKSGIPASQFTTHKEHDPMVYKRGQTYWYKFSWSVRDAGGKSKSFLVRRSARTKVVTEAEGVEHEHGRALRLGEIQPI